MNGGRLLVWLSVAIAIAAPSLAQPSEPPANHSEEPGSVVVFPKFMRGTVAVDGVTRPQTEIDIRARCPSSTTCGANELVKIRFHWVCPGSEDVAPNYVCKEAGFNVQLSVDAKISFNPEDPSLVGSNPGSIAPCSKGFLIGWVISPTTNHAIKYDALTGDALLRNSDGLIQTYQAVSIRADPNLATRAEIASEIDPRTGTPALVFDGGVGHYQAVAGEIPTTLEYHKLSGPLSSNHAFLVLLTLEVRLNRPNYPTFVDLDFRTAQGARASTVWNFTCWTEIQRPNIDANFTLAGAQNRSGVVLSGSATKVPAADISDIPGPVTLLGLVPTDEEGGRRTMEPLYVITRVDGNTPTTVFLPFR